jgi:hypothetical protein
MKHIKLGFFIGLIGMLFPFLSHGQSNSLGDRAPVSAEPQTHVAHKKQRLTRRQKMLFRKPNVKHTAQYEFYVRIEKAAKAKQRMLRKMSTPQYSDFTYFGHKRPPKRHLPFAMRYCKECGIRH